MRKGLTLTVNGEKHHVDVTDRTQLVEVLRDHLDLTGTHIGCEQGVCGACTVIVDGKPVRSCITFANSCDGAHVETIEGHAGDPVMTKIRDAFSRHHALQCGFCTPGMLATARDILERFPAPTEEKIRVELSGNLCRCTGYQGIVSAIQDVAQQLARQHTDPSTQRVTSDDRKPVAFSTFEPVFPETVSDNVRASKGSVQTEGNWTVVDRAFELPYPQDKVWSLFSDVGKVAECVPGASLTELSDSGFQGAVAIAFGPIKAQFGGSGTFQISESDHSGFLAGQGADKGGQSNVKGELHYSLDEGESPATTRVKVQFRFQIQGLLAQFNRPELVTGFVDFLLEKFIANCNAVLSGGTASASHKIGVFALVWAVLRSVFKRA